MSRRLLATTLAVLAGLSLAACSPIATPTAERDTSSSASPSDEQTTNDEPVDEPADDTVDEFGFTAAQRTLIDEMMVATVGMDYSKLAALDADQAANVAEQYMTGADAICQLPEAGRDGAHDGFVGSFTSTSGLDADTAETVWQSIITYCTAIDG
jgi:hypothetical protein